MVHVSQTITFKQSHKTYRNDVFRLNLLQMSSKHIQTSHLVQGLKTTLASMVRFTTVIIKEVDAAAAAPQLGSLVS